MAVSASLDPQRVRSQAVELRKAVEETRLDILNPYGPRAKRCADKLTSARFDLTVLSTNAAWSQMISTYFSADVLMKSMFSAPKADVLSPLMIRGIVQQPYLVVSAGTAREVHYLNPREPFTVGRNHQRALADEQFKRVSRDHVTFRATIGPDGRATWFAEDSSTHGTYRNNSKMSGRAQLRSGDVLTLADAGSDAPGVVFSAGEATDDSPFAGIINDTDVCCLVLDATQPAGELELAMVGARVSSSAWGMLLVPVGPKEAVMADDGAVATLLTQHQKSRSSGNSGFDYLYVYRIDAVPATNPPMGKSASDLFPELPEIAKKLQTMVNTGGELGRARAFQQRVNEIREACVSEVKREFMTARSVLLQEREKRSQTEMELGKMQNAASLVTGFVPRYFADLRERITEQREVRESTYLEGGVIARACTEIEALVPVTLSDHVRHHTELLLVPKDVAASLGPKHQLTASSGSTAERMQNEVHQKLISGLGRETIVWARNWIQLIGAKKGDAAVGPMVVRTNSALQSQTGLSQSLDAKAADDLVRNAQIRLEAVESNVFRRPDLSTHVEIENYIEYLFKSGIAPLFRVLMLLTIAAPLVLGQANFNRQTFLASLQNYSWFLIPAFFAGTAWSFFMFRQKKIEKETERMRDQLTNYYKGAAADVLKQCDRVLQDLIKSLESLFGDFINDAKEEMKGRREAATSDLNKSQGLIRDAENRANSLEAVLKRLQAI